ncbi:OmpA/MotB domain protein [Spirochaeta thermophila DSM 6578]|uniref:OmpA/MotB domain protein n=1 Tax=Winmispira thermophila (strain ATCC 700085 / DSM 6578 / Z-1203) TaxID=869211 RepID=G0GDN2_WINT7|nr:FlgD immunoglobulin-like domain containing protein [Spirochaeta thermophila]AEJ61379.1 OmpA/MotB domain protein [Spirochaeta thermophila DSM 6578]
MKQYVRTVTLLILCSGLALVGQYVPSPLGESFSVFSSPVLVGTDALLLSGDLPSTGMVNPAAGAGEQRTTLELGYTGGISSENGYALHGFSLGMAFPTRYGVFSPALMYVGSGMDEIPVGSTFGVSLTAAKDVFEDVWVGMGLRVLFGNADRYDVGAGGDLGALFLLQQVGLFKDARLGVTLAGLGKGYSPSTDIAAFPPLFTPGITFDGLLFDGSMASLRVGAGLSFPSFQNAILKTGFRLGLGEVVEIYTGYVVNAREWLDEDVPLQHVYPSISVGASFPVELQQSKGLLAEQGWTKSELRPRFALAPLNRGLWLFSGGVNVPLGVIDRNPPKVEISYPENPYISPNNDGVQDELLLPLSITDERFVMGYTLVVEDEQGSEVRRIENKEVRPTERDVKTFFKELVRPKSGIPVPESLRWDGFGESGGVVPDGTYFVHLEAWDDNGNTISTEPYRVVVDATPPRVDVKVASEDAKIFSPNGDGFKDEVEIVQEGSVEERWEGRILTQKGEVVRRFEWKDAAPQTIVWDGKDDEGTLCPDGVYSYEIAAKDRAGNAVKATITNLVISTEPTPVALKVDAAYFSPNGDGVKDVIRFELDVPVKRGIVRWSLQIVEIPSRNTVYRREGTDVPPASFVFDGKTADGRVLPEGEYQALLMVEYQNGNRPEAGTPTFVLDVTPPSVMVEIPDPIFSPNGDGRKDTLPIIHKNATKDPVWEASIHREDGVLVRTFSWQNGLPERFEWDGRTEGTGLALDGRYYYLVEATDQAGNSFTSERVFFTLSTEQTPVLLSVNYDIFSPNGDGRRDSLIFYPQIKETSLLRSYTLKVLSEKGEVVRSFTGGNRIPEQIVWNGRNEKGETVPDGGYTAELTAEFTNGNIASAKVSRFVVDTKAPALTFTVENRIFSPNGDGKKDACIFRQSSPDSAVWVAHIRDTQGKILREFRWEGTVTDLLWDGTDSAGNKVKDGTYTYLLTGRDAAENEVVRKVDEIVLDTRPVRVFLTVTHPAFSPNGDGNLDVQPIKVYTSPSDGIEEWTLEFVRDGKVEKRLSGKEIASEYSLNWDGRSDAGDYREGTYVVRYTVKYLRGDEMTVESSPFVLDVQPPELSISLSPTPFSPDNDGVDDELAISIRARDLTGIQTWEIVITDPYGNPFTRFGGQGSPAPQIIWDGRSLSGELVSSAEDYPLIFTATDRVGNTARFETKVSVDVLVIREGDKLKIKISSIHFPPNKADLILDESEEGRKNRAIIERLVQIFTKYRRYKIRIEGHAVNLSGTEREEREELVPLSLARAEAVKQALVAMGLDPGRITTAGMGGRFPIVPHTDEKNRWKNRRVEFILLKE